MGVTDDSSLRRIKSEHLKKRGDAALKDGNCREAWLRYTEALALNADSTAAHRILANRSLAYLRAKCLDEALADGLAAAAAAPMWDKAHWRAGAALLALRRIPEAVASFLSCWQCSAGDTSCEKMLWGAVQRLTREQLGCGIIALCAALQEHGGLAAPSAEEVTPQVAQEAWFKTLKSAHEFKPKPGPYYERYTGWLKGGLPPHEGYLERAGMHLRARAYLQAAEDGQAAVEATDALLQISPAASSTLTASLVTAYFRLGEAFAAEKDHEDRDPRKAAKAFAMGLDLDPENEKLREALQGVSDDLTGAQLKMVGVEVYQAAAGKGRVLQNPTAYGVLEAGKAGESLYRLDVSLDFPEAKPQSFGPAPREALRSAVAAAAGVSKMKVMIDHVRAPTKRQPVLELHFQVQLGGDAAKGHAFATALKEDPFSVLGGSTFFDALGHVDPATLFVGVADVTPTGPLQDVVQSPSSNAPTNLTQDVTGADATKPAERRMIPLPRPKMELALPYGAYRLVRTDGSAPERTDKHPFCMSRVYYDPSERPEEVWAEMADGSCRWRQTGSEVKIIALKVPREVAPRDICVTFEPYFLKVEHRRTGEVWLEGTLERGIVPEGCVWTAGQGDNEDGFLLLLQKMNLELLRQHWMHSEMWWPRLFTSHSEIAWDDYEKDYSDLPPEVMKLHREAEAIKDVERRQEGAEKSSRDRLQERDDARKRTRQERLHELRTGNRKDWVALSRTM